MLTLRPLRLAHHLVPFALVLIITFLSPCSRALAQGNKIKPAGGSIGCTVSVTVSPGTSTVCKGDVSSWSASYTTDCPGYPSYQWSIDGVNASWGTGPSFSALFGTTGSHTVSCRVTMRQGNSTYGSGSGSAAVTVIDCGHCNQTGVIIQANPTSGCVGDVFAFHAALTGWCDGNNAPLFTWDFGDGSAPVSGVYLTDVTHSFSSAGSYTVTVTVDDGTLHAQAFKMVTVNASGISGVSGSANPNPTCTGTQITFTASASSSCLSGSITYTWVFGDGGGGSGNPAYHSYATAGTYTVTVTASSGASSAQNTFTVTVSAGAPGVPGGLGATASAHSVSLTWSAVSGATSYNVYRSTSGGAYTQVGSSATASYTDSSVDQLTSYCYEVSAVNNCGESARSAPACVTTTCDHVVTIQDVSATPNPAVIGQAINFNATATESCNSSLSYSWTFGDGQGASGQSVSHAYAAAGTYVAEVTVTGPGGQATGQVVVTVLSGRKKNTPGSPPGTGAVIPIACGGPGAGGTSAGIALPWGNVETTTTDPVPTRGWPLVNNIHVNSQYVEGSRAMLNATFTYDIYVTTDKVYGDDCTFTQHWFLVDGDGTRMDFGVSSGAPQPPPGVFSRLSGTQGGGWVLQNAGPPESIGEAGNFTYYFDGQGKLTQIQDPTGNLQNVFYSGGLISSVQDVSTGKSLNFYNDGTSNISRIVQNGGAEVTRLTYSAGGLSQIEIKNAQGVTLTSVQYGYQWAGGRLQLSSMTLDNDPASTVNFQTTWWPSVDCSSQVALESGSLAGGLPLITYNPPQTSPGAAYTYTVTNHKGGTTVYDFDASDNLIRVTLPTLAGSTGPTFFNFTYNAQHQVTSATDGTYHEGLIYDNQVSRMLTEVEAPAGEWFLSWSGTDLTEFTDPLQHIFNLWYEDQAQPHIATRLQDTAGKIWLFAHNASGQVTQVTPPAGSPTGPVTVTYDETPNSATLGYPLMVNAANLEQVTFDSYDVLGDLLQVSTYPAGFPVSTQFSYDAAQRLTGILLPDGKGVQYSYTGRNLTSVTDPASTSIFFNWCAPCGLLTDVSGPLNWSLHWVYDQDHDLQSFVDARGNSTGYSYGLAGELTKITYPDTTTIQATYNTAGLVQQVINGRGQQIMLGYDASERLTGVSFPSGGAANLSFYYNTDDSLSSFTDGLGTTSVSYDPAGRVQSVTYNYAAIPANTLNYAYNPDGSRASMTWTSGVNTVGTWYYGYDQAGRLTSVRNPWSEQTSWSYDGEGKIASQSNGNGTSLSIQYNQQRGWPTSLQWNSGPAPFAQYGLAYDSGNNTVGNLTGVAELDGSTVSFGYDALYRLTAEQRVGTNPLNNAYQYDLAGNRTQTSFYGGQVVTSYSFDGANKYIGNAYDRLVSYDADGNLLSLNFPNMTGHSGLAWDARGNMTAADGASFGYDALGRCVYLNVPQSGGLGAQSVNPSPPSQRFLIYDGSLVIGEVAIDPSSGSASVYSAYTWGASGLVSERLLWNGQNRSLFYHFGPQGETRQLTDSTGTIADTYLFNSYGVPGPSTGSDYNPFRYGGQFGYYTPQDNFADLILCGARWYSPSQGRWTSRDPAGYLGGPNLYEYCTSNPVFVGDPSGLGQQDDGGGPEIIDANGHAIPYRRAMGRLSQYVTPINAGVHFLAELHPWTPMAKLLTGRDNYGKGLSGGGYAMATFQVASGPVLRLIGKGLSGILANARQGCNFERSVLTAMSAEKNTQVFAGNALNGKLYNVIPDIVQMGAFIDAKSNVLYVPFSKQMQAMVDAAEKEGASMNLIVSMTSKVSPRLQTEIERLNGSIFRFDPSKGRFFPYP